MKALAEAIKTVLRSITPKAYYLKAPATAEYPYAVFKFPNSTDNGPREDFTLEIDFWDTNPDTTALETVVQNVDDTFNFLSINTAGVVTTLYRKNRLRIPDPDPTIERRQLRYTAQTYFK